MKKSTKIILIAILLLTIIFAVAACKTKTEIAVTDNSQTVFVKGNDLDLSAIKLTVTKGGALSEIALNAEGVTVTGYDKNTVGEQTLTISYDGASATMTVNVVERMVALGHVTDYVVGDNFDLTGSLKITKDDGQSVSVRLNDSKVTLTGFDSATSGEKTISATYTDGSLTLNGSFNVNVWDSNNVQLTVPTKVIYDSHEEISANGGYLTVTAKSGAVTRTIQIKPEWIKGFNPDVVTEEEPTKKQEITIDYPGQSVKYNIEIRLSDVTRIQRAVKTLSVLDWTGETPCDVSDEQGQLAMRALGLYNNLNKYDTYLISNEDMLNVVRPAAVYGTKTWTDLAKDFEGLFSVKSQFLSINCEKADVTKTQFNAISALQETSPLFTYGDLLIKAAESFGDEVVFGDEKFTDYIQDVCGKEELQKAISKIDLMLKMHQALADVPANWQVSDLQTSETSAKVEQAADFAIALSELTESISERYLFNTVSQWRPENKDDYFEILYRYYFAMYLSDDEEAQKAGVQGIDNLIDVCMPGLLESYYLQYVSTLLSQYELQYTASEGVLIRPAYSIDTISFIINYRSLLKLREDIYNSDDEMFITLFNEYSLSNIISQIQTADIGAFSIFGAANGEPAFDNLWTKYLDAIVEIGNSSSEEYSAQVIKSLFKAFIDLSPEMQSQFLASLNPYGWYDFYVDDGTDRSTMFATLIIAYYLDALPESLVADENSIVFGLFDAFQYFLYRGESTGEGNPTFLDAFLILMGDVEEKYGALAGADKTAFDTNIGFFYEKLLNIYKLYNEDGKFVEKEIPEEWADKITELEKAFEGVYTTFIRAYMDYSYYPVYISAYEYTADLYNDIIANAPQAVVDKVLYSNTLKMFAGTEMEIALGTSHESFFYVLRSLYISMLLEYPINEEYAFTAWEEYTSSNLREYFVSLLDFYAAVTEDPEQLTDEMIKAVLSDFQKLTDDEQALFVAMDGYGQFYYYYGLGAFFANKFASSDSAEALEKLLEDVINVEVSCAFGITEQEFIDAWKDVQASYDALSEADKALFDEFLKEKYDSYNDIYTELSAETTPSEDEAQA